MARAYHVYDTYNGNSELYTPSWCHSATLLGYSICFTLLYHVYTTGRLGPRMLNRCRRTQWLHAEQAKHMRLYGFAIPVDTATSPRCREVNLPSLVGTSIRVSHPVSHLPYLDCSYSCLQAFRTGKWIGFHSHACPPTYLIRAEVPPPPHQ